MCEALLRCENLQRTSCSALVTVAKVLSDIFSTFLTEVEALRNAILVPLMPKKASRRVNIARHRQEHRSHRRVFRRSTPVNRFRTGGGAVRTANGLLKKERRLWFCWVKVLRKVRSMLLPESKELSNLFFADLSHIVHWRKVRSVPMPVSKAQSNFATIAMAEAKGLGKSCSVEMTGIAARSKVCGSVLMSQVD